ncbi:THAP domain containing 5 [Phyllostomus discolor]|uniref:THAP domain-containing protein 5 n=1 Tax=Phyllostomus discolor TaxID=89673 RepID=A0A834DNT0_9CHIR|nr:THAP domain containing 5 [Phyllostomus discolor]
MGLFRFPLHDKERLEKWLKNMKRDSWMPSKYQFLCSDHFTPDSLDVRWGIRYLKHTAVPTIFSLPGDSQEEDPSKNNCPKKQTENSKPTMNSFLPAQKEAVDPEDTGTDDSLYKDVDFETDVLQIEHSYCRQDTNKEHLWQKVSKLHSKITLLELQEQQTLGRLKCLEALIRQLKQENWLSEENVKIIENHFTTYEVTMM